MNTYDKSEERWPNGMLLSANREIIVLMIVGSYKKGKEKRKSPDLHYSAGKEESDATVRSIFPQVRWSSRRKWQNRNHHFQ